MSSQDDASVSRSTFFDVIFGLTLLGGATLVGLYYLWSQHQVEIKQATFDSALILRYIQYPFTVIGSESYSKLILRMPELKIAVTAENMSTNVFLALLAVCFRSIIILMGLLMIPKGIYKIINKSKLAFTRDLSLNDLIAIQRDIYPRIKPATAVNLWNVNSRFGPWASHFNFTDICIDRNFFVIENRRDLFSPAELELFNKRLDTISLVGLKNPAEYHESTPEPSYSEFKGLKYPTGFPLTEQENVDFLYDNIHHYCGVLRVKKEVIYQYYRSSLGELCRYKGRIIDAEYLPPSERAIWMLLCSCIPANSSFKARVETILDRMSDSFIEGTYRSTIPDHSIDFSDVLELYNDAKHDTSLKVLLVDIASNHAYYYTAFSKLFYVATARYSRLITRDFHWLKTVNRTLFFALNQVGMEVARPETAGIRCHYSAEVKARKKIIKPIVDNAVIYFLHSLYQEGYTAIPDTESTTLGQTYWLGSAPKEIE
jgi:hypothetical protein